jgi:predicted amidohydrolase
MVAAAAKAGCDVVVLPECLDFGWTDPTAKERAHPIPGPNSNRLAKVAKANSIHVVAGLVEREGDRLFNCAVLLSPQGELLGKHRKINELDFAREIYSTGSSVSVVDTELGKVGLSVCADNFPENLEFARAQCRMGARYLLSPCAWAVPANHDNLHEPYGGLWKRAYAEITHDFQVTMVGVTNVGWIAEGPWKGRKCIGCSLAMGPGGQILAEAPYGEEAEVLTVVEVD